MSTTRAHTRVFAFIGALLFFVTSCALTAAVLWQIHQDNQKPKPANTTNQSTSKEGKLEGTKLAGFTPVQSVDKLQVVDIKQGDGAEVKAGDTITAHYTGASALDGVIFESSKDAGRPATFSLSGVIQGWQQGVPGMKVGGIRRLIIPADLAYGAQGSPPKITANEPLVFDIELLGIGNGQQ